MRAASFRLLRDCRGATAIEYAILAGLIGLGLVGSLVVTKGSLNTVFGTASSKMADGASATPGTPAVLNLSASTSPRQPFWTAKGMTAAPQLSTSGTKTTTTYTFNDGTVANFTKDSTDGALSLSWLDPSGSRPIQLKVGASATGYTNFVGVYAYVPGGAYVSDSYVSSTGTTWSGSPPMPARYDTIYTNASGQVTGGAWGQSTGTFAPWATMGYQDMAYFMDLAKQ